MPVSTTNAISSLFTTNGSTTVFPFTFTAPSTTEVAVVLRDDTTGVETVVDPATYTVSLTGGGGGSVTMDAAPASGSTLYVLLDPDFTQDVEFANGSEIRASDLNALGDESTARDQALKRDLDLSLKLPQGSTSTTAIAITGGQVLGYVNDVFVGVDNDAASTAQVAADRVAVAADRAVVVAAKEAVQSAEQDAETAAAAAVAAGNYAADVAAGEAAYDDGETFWVPSGDDAVFYIMVSGSAVATGFTMPGLATVESILNIADGYLPVTRKSIDAGSSNIQYASDGFWERVSGTGTMLGFVPMLPSDLLEANIYVHFPFTGTFSDVPDAQLFDSVSTPIGSRIDGVVVGSEYVVTLPISSTPDLIRTRWSTTGTGRVKDPYVTYDGQTLVDPATVGGKRAISEWIDEVTDAAGNMLAPDFSLVGNAVVAADNRTVAFATNRNTDVVRQYINGIAGPTDYVSVLVKIESLPGFTFRDFVIRPDTGLGGGTNAQTYKVYRYGDYAVVRGLAAGAASAAARYIDLLPDTRAQGTIPQTALTLQFLGVFVGDIDPAKLMADPDALLAACADKQARECTVGASLTGDATFATTPEAVRAGFGYVRFANTHERLPTGCFLPPYIHLENIGTGFASCGVSTVIGDWTATAADANVYYLPLAYDPVQLWEVLDSDGSVTGMGVAPASGADLFLWEEAANEAAVQSNAGSFWYGAGTEGTGLYMRPVGDVTAGKTWEYAAQNGQHVFTAWRGAKLTGMGARYSISDAIYADKGHLQTRACKPQYSGQNGIFCNTGCDLTDFHSEPLGNFNDGVNWNGSGGEIALWGTKANANRQDGVAGGHANGYSRLTGDFTASDNGKQGVVMVGPTDIDATIRGQGNRSSDFLLAVTVAVPCKISMTLDAGPSGEVSLSNSSSSAFLTGNVTGVWGTLNKTNSVVTAFELTGTAS